MDEKLMKNLYLVRYAHGFESTTGLLFLENQFYCYTLEDAPQVTKIYGKTRIPHGRYRLSLRTEGRMHRRYGQRYPSFHKGMIELEDVPNFTYILIHQGNWSSDTEGCILVGTSANSPHKERGMVGRSGVAYKEMYRIVADWIKSGEEVYITISDMDC
jgi:hypothetical protein